MEGITWIDCMNLDMTSTWDTSALLWMSNNTAWRGDNEGQKVTSNSCAWHDKIKKSWLGFHRSSYEWNNPCVVIRICSTPCWMHNTATMVWIYTYTTFLCEALDFFFSFRFYPSEFWRAVPSITSKNKVSKCGEICIFIHAAIQPWLDTKGYGSDCWELEDLYCSPQRGIYLIWQFNPLRQLFRKIKEQAEQILLVVAVG